MRTLFLFICCTCFFSCRKNTSKPEPPDNPGNTDTVQLKPGTPVDKGDLIPGSQTVATIGASGGTIVSDDGKFTLTVPAGAFDATTTVTISRRKPSVFMSVGTAGYEVSRNPERPLKGDVFISTRYTPADLNGTAPEGVRLAAYEEPKPGEGKGTFHRVPGTQRSVDKANRTVRFRVKPERWKNLFAYYADFKLLTVYADGSFEEHLTPLRLSLNENIEFRLVRMGRQTEPDEDLLMPLTDEKVPIPLTKEQIVRWTMNDAPATANPGNLYGHLKSAALPNAWQYQAPSKLPNDTGFVMILKADLRVPHPTNPAITSEVQLIQELSVKNLTYLEMEGKVENMEAAANKSGAQLQLVVSKHVIGATQKKAAVVVQILAYASTTEQYSFTEAGVTASNSITGSGKEFASSYTDKQGNTVYTSGTVKVRRNRNNRLYITVEGTLARRTSNGVETQPINCVGFFGAPPF